MLQYLPWTTLGRHFEYRGNILPPQSLVDIFLRSHRHLAKDRRHPHIRQDHHIPYGIKR